MPAGLECLLDFGQDPAEDAWSFSCALTNLRGGMISAGAEYQSSADSSSYAGSLRIFVDEGWGAETVVLSSDWDRESGALEVSLDDGDAVRSIQCSLLVDRNRAELNADCFDALLHSRDGYLELRLTADKRDRAGGSGLYQSGPVGSGCPAEDGGICAGVADRVLGGAGILKWR